MHISDPLDANDARPRAAWESVIDGTAPADPAATIEPDHNQPRTFANGAPMHLADQPAVAEQAAAARQAVPAPAGPLGQIRSYVAGLKDTNDQLTARQYLISYSARVRKLSRMANADLARIYVTVLGTGYTGDPLHLWSQDELVNAVIAAEYPDFAAAGHVLAASVTA